MRSYFDKNKHLSLLGLRRAYALMESFFCVDLVLPGCFFSTPELQLRFGMVSGDEQQHKTILGLEGFKGGREAERTGL